MKILITSHKFYPDIGGIETISEILASYFATSGHTVRLLTQSPYPYNKRPAFFPFEVIRCPTPLQLLRCFLWSDIVFQNNIELRLLWPRLLVHRPVVIALHTWIRSIQGQRNLIHKLKVSALHAANAVLACSEAVRTDSCSGSIVVGNTYNHELFRLRPDIQRQNSIVFLGRLVSDKGVDLLLHAFSSLHCPDWHLTIIGSGPELQLLQDLATFLGISQSVSFAGPLQGVELAKTLNAHELMVVPSRWQEPFGLVVLEGLASGCVVLSSDGGGLPDAVGPCGILFRRGDVVDLGLKLRLLIQDYNLRTTLRNAAKTHLEKFQPDFVCSRYLETLERVYHQRMP